MVESTSSSSPNQPEARFVRCAKLGDLRPALSRAPFPNRLGERILEQVSQEAWSLWLVQSRMIVNEHRLNLASAEARNFLMEQCEKFLFGGGEIQPPDYTPPASN